MGLEAASFLGDLVTTNPDGADSKGQGDDHIRLMKSVLQATFTGMIGRAWRSQTKGGTYTPIATDNMSVLNCTTGLTLNLTAAATLGNGWVTLVHANGGNVTVDPNAAELINGAASIVIPNGYSALVMCDGSGFVAAMFARNGSFESGTRVVFQQTSAPSGWTKESSATYNDTALRFTTGSVTTGGADAFSTHFGTGKLTSGTALTQAQTPVKSHTHGFSLGADSGGDHAHGQNHNQVGGSPASTRSYLDGTDASGSTTDEVGPVSGDPAPGQRNASRLNTDSGGAHGHSVSGSITAASDATASAHDHPLPNFNIKFADCIIAAKN